MFFILAIVTVAVAKKVESDREKENAYASATPKSRMLFSTRVRG